MTRFKIIFLLFMLTSCGLKQVVIPNIDMAIGHKIEKDLDLYYKQTNQLNSDIDKLLNKLAKPAELIIKPILNSLDINKLNDSEVAKIQKNINRFYLEASNEFGELLSKYLGILDQKQFNVYLKNYDKELNDIEKRSKKYNTDLIKQRFEFFLGNLNYQQAKIIDEFKPKFIQRNITRFNMRNELKQKIINQFNSTLNQEEKTKKIREVITEYNKKMNIYFEDKETTLVYYMALKVINASSDEQKQRLESKFKMADEWAEYFISYQY